MTRSSSAVVPFSEKTLAVEEKSNRKEVCSQELKTNWFFEAGNKTYEYKNESPGNPIGSILFTHEAEKFSIKISLRNVRRNIPAIKKLFQDNKIENRFLERSFFYDEVNQEEDGIKIQVTYPHDAGEGSLKRNLILLDCHKKIELISIYFGCQAQTVKNHMIAHCILQDSIIERYFDMKNKNSSSLSGEQKKHFKDLRTWLLINFRGNIIQELCSYCEKNKTEVCTDFLRMLQDNFEPNAFGLIFDVARDLCKRQLPNAAITVYGMIDSEDQFFDQACLEIATLRLFFPSDQAEVKDEARSLDGVDVPQEQLFSSCIDILQIFFKMNKIDESAAALLKVLCFRMVGITSMTAHLSEERKALSGKIETLIGKNIGRSLEKEGFTSDFLLLTCGYIAKGMESGRSLSQTSASASERTLSASR